MNDKWLEGLDEKTVNFLNSIRKEENNFSFYPLKRDFTKVGEKLNLGFSCYALKLFHILNIWNELDEKDSSEWKLYLNSFQKNYKSYPSNSFIDDEFLNGYEKLDFSQNVKFQLKKLINEVSKKDYELKNQKIITSIRAETKQAISSLYEVKSTNLKPYTDFPKKPKDIEDFLNGLDWNLPWSSGAQYAGICVFAQTQQYEEKETTLNYLREFSDKLVNTEYGIYQKDKITNSSETINGVMKVLTGLDWIDKEIHFPEKLIDLCLNSKPSQEGCDLVDIVYVLYRCSLQTTYKRDDVINYLKDLISLIKHHSFEDGGFSYFINKSQTHYYGLRISNGPNLPDLHGTTLLVWALSMIFNTINPDESNWNVLKP